MKYICLECARTFDDPEICVERHGFTDGLYEKYSVCPYCGGGYTEVATCAFCGKETFEDELLDGICDDCIDEYKYDVDMCTRIGGLEKVSVEINLLYASLYSAQDIEELIRRDIEDTLKIKKVDCSAFIEKDKLWFAERLNEEVNKNENAKS